MVVSGEARPTKNPLKKADFFVFLTTPQSEGCQASLNNQSVVGLTILIMSKIDKISGVLSRLNRDRKLLQKGGDPSAPSRTDTLLRLDLHRRIQLEGRKIDPFGYPRLCWSDGRIEIVKSYFSFPPGERISRTGRALMMHCRF